MESMIFWLGVLCWVFSSFFVIAGYRRQLRENNECFIEGINMMLDATKIMHECVVSLKEKSGTNQQAAENDALQA